MIQFVCDSCNTVKAPEETWIVGLAAEAVGFTAARREVNILSTWDNASSVHPLAVHFCSEECKDNYIQKLFGNGEGQLNQPNKTAAKSKVRTPSKRSRRAA